MSNYKPLSGWQFLWRTALGVTGFLLAVPWILGEYVSYVKWVASLFHPQ